LGYHAGSQMLGVDVSLALYGGATPGTMSLITNVSGSQISTPVDDNANWGQLSYSTPSLAIPGTTASSLVYLDLQLWEANFSTYPAAYGGFAYTADTGPFLNPSGGGITPASTLVGMPDVILDVPEPSIAALSLLGVAALLLRRRVGKI